MLVLVLVALSILGCTNMGLTDLLRLRSIFNLPDPPIGNDLPEQGGIFGRDYQVLDDALPGNGMASVASGLMNNPGLDPTYPNGDIGGNLTPPIQPGFESQVPTISYGTDGNERNDA